MPFTKRAWADNPAGGTPIDAANLNRIEEGIAAAAEAAASYTVVGTTAGAYPTTRPTGAGRVWFDDPAVTPPAWATERDRWTGA